jgi:predicted O-methyltransferase YrrM
MNPTGALRRVRVKAALRDSLKAFGLHGLLDAPFRDLLQDAATSRAVRLPPLYPINAAANYSLLYCLFRILTETECKRVLEIGAGQTTLVLSALGKARALEVDTLETSEEWAARLKETGDTRVHYSPLVMREQAGITAQHFEDTKDLRNDYDFVLVDGPLGTPRYSRYACMSILRERLADEFVVVFDDAERRGEQDTIKAFLATPKGRDLGMTLVGGTKWQCLLYTKRYSVLQYY